ncbi:unnamed protein product [Clonostachys rosea]|uniref:Uncharacterized protein n=1 Tax=Bionectria ochroleuca TaxID=29856 RepID=A0ABY6U6C3_BIOOC|nr:unnamed protein product [Clonostachys rosea]
MVGATQLGLAALVWLGLASRGLALSIDQATDDLNLVARDDLEPRLLFGSLEKTKAQMALAAKGKRDSEELDERDLEERLYLAGYEKYAKKKQKRFSPGKAYLKAKAKHQPYKVRRSL